MENATKPPTIWSETLLDILCDAVRRKNEAETRKLLKEMRGKNYKKREIRKHAAKLLEPADAAFLERVLKTLRSRT